LRRPRRKLKLEEIMNRIIVHTAVVSGLIFGTTVAASSQPVPDWDINGHIWTCTEKCVEGRAGKPTNITQNGGKFIFEARDAGLRGEGTFEGDHTIRFPSWDLTVVVAPDLKSVKFSNGVVWSVTK
jgi:hypothetical protein